ncbi:MAG TPA: hypothetical protein VJR47_10705 [Stellaceae bacterium]|nr:hypothetical protein [Stellaceae bacterium]
MTMPRRTRRGGLRALAALAALMALAAPASAADEHALKALPADVMPFPGMYAAQDVSFWRDDELEAKTVFIAGVGSSCSAAHRCRRK